MKPFRHFSAYLLCSALAAACLDPADARADIGAVTYPTTRETLNARIRTIMREKNVVGLSIALIDDRTTERS